MKSIRRTIATISLAFMPLVGSAFNSPAAAADVRCGQLITQSIVLTHDVGPCAGDGLIVGANNITLDLGGHRVFGTPARAAFAGIRLPQRSGVIVQRGIVSGFDAGILIRGGSGNTLRQLAIRDNIGPADREADLGDGIFVEDSPNNSILSNAIVHNGGFDGIGVFGVSSSRTTIRGNSITDTVGVDLSAEEGGVILGHGVLISGVSGTLSQPLQFSRHNDVTGNAIVRNNGAGVLAILTQDGFIRQNAVVANGGGIGLGSVVPQGRGYFEPTRMLVEQNRVRRNRSDGISVGTQQNRILNNVSTGNALDGPGRFDLHDGNVDPETLLSDCDQNVWFGNTWGAFPGTSLGSYRPECVTTGGSGPKPSYFQPGGASVASASVSADPVTRQVPPPR